VSGGGKYVDFLENISPGLTNNDSNIGRLLLNIGAGISSMFRLKSADQEELISLWGPPDTGEPPLPSSSSNDQIIGLGLAISSSVFIGASFVIKRRGLRQAGSTGLRAGD
jgi:hypothetical protein